MKKFNEDLYEIAMIKGEEAEKLKNSDIEREKESLRKAERKYRDKLDY